MGRSALIEFIAGTILALAFFRPAAAAAVLHHRLRSSSYVVGATTASNASAAGSQLDHHLVVNASTVHSEFENASVRAATDAVLEHEPIVGGAKHEPMVVQSLLQDLVKLEDSAFEKPKKMTYWQTVHYYAACVCLFFVIICACGLCGGRLMRFFLITCCNSCMCILMPIARCLDSLAACCGCGPSRREDAPPTAQQGEAQHDLNRVQREMEREEFDQTMCPICLEALPTEDDGNQDLANETTELPCRHKFHQRCIEEWAVQQRHSNCPLCRSDVTQETLNEADRRKPESYQRRLRFYLARLRERHPESFDRTRTEPLYNQDRDGRWAMAVPVGLIGGFLLADSLTQAHTGFVGDSSGGGGMVGDMFPGDPSGGGGFDGGGGGCGGGCGGG